MADRVYKPIKNSKGAGGLCGPGPGRPKGSDKRAFREHGAEAIEIILHLMRKGRSDKTRLSAATYLADQSFGKAQQGLTIDTTEVAETLIGIITTIPELAEQKEHIADAITRYLQ